MTAISLQSIGLAAVVIVVVLVAIAAFVLDLVFTVRRRRRERRREEEARRAWEERLSALSPGGVLGLAAGLEGVRLASLAIGVGSELAKQGFAPVVAGSLRRLADIAETDRPPLRRAIADDGTVTLMFSDIEGSTSLNQALGDEAWLQLLGAHDAIVRRLVKSGRGQVVKTQGDSFMVAFKEVPAAVSCAIEIQRALAEADLARSHPMRVRIGLHTGEVTKQGRDLFGINVALAARVADAAQGAEILVSSAVRKQAHDGIRYGKGRKVTLKGFSSPEQVYEVEWRKNT
jgi:class 3 adenylate cyclase